MGLDNPREGHEEESLKVVGFGIGGGREVGERGGAVELVERDENVRDWAYGYREEERYTRCEGSRDAVFGFGWARNEATSMG